MAGNPHKGEIEFTAAGQERRLRFDTNAICELEIELDQSIGEIAGQLVGSPRLGLVRSVFKAGIIGGVTLAETSEILDDLGLARAARLLAQAFELSLPMQKDTEARPTPTPRRVGSGRGS